MFSFNPFNSYDYVRPKSYSLFDDDYYQHPFSSGLYVRDQPSLFRSSSFRQPRYCPSSYYQSTNQSKQQSSDEDDDYDPFLDIFGLSNRQSKRKQCKEKKIDEFLKQQSKQQSKQQQSKQSKEEQLKQQEQKSSSKDDLSQSTSIKYRELDSQRLDSDNVIEIKFPYYKCNDPSKIEVTVTKDDYIVLKTADNYQWKSRLPDNVDVSKASCTCVNKCLSLKLHKIENESTMKVEQNKSVDDQQPKVNETKTNDTKIDQSEENEMQVDESKVVETKDEFDPDAPIVEDIIEDDF